MSSKLQPNVNEAANAAFIQELKGTDLKRFKRVAKCDATARKVMPNGEGWTIGVCAACGGAVVGASFVEREKQTGRGREFCSRACRDSKAVVVIGALRVHKYATVEERQAARRAKEAARQAGLRLGRVA